VSINPFAKFAAFVPSDGVTGGLNAVEFLGPVAAHLGHLEGKCAA
jgi:hypothetical protein